MKSSSELLDCRSLEPGSVIDVETTSRHYRIECLGGNSIRVSGHPQYCPTPVVAELEGSVTGDGTLEEGVIERGMRLALLIAEHCPMTTSKVVRVQLENQPHSTASIH
jgi:hypothetical protein